MTTAAAAAKTRAALHAQLLDIERQHRAALDTERNILRAAQERLKTVNARIEAVRPRVLLDDRAADPYQALILERGALHQTLALAEQTVRQTSRGAEIPLAKATFKDQPGYDLHEGPKGKNRWMREGEEAMPAFIRSSTVQQAEQEALKLGVQSADYQQSLDIANEVNTALEDLQQRGFAMPDHAKINDQFFLRWAAQLGANPNEFPAAFVNSRQTGETYIFANPLYRYWSQLAQDAAQQHQRGEWSTAHPHHAIRHEMGHLLFYRANPARYAALRLQQFTGSDLQTAQKVSLYAGNSALEFIAETFALLVDGKTPAADVLKLYNQLGGIHQ